MEFVCWKFDLMWQTLKKPSSWGTATLSYVNNDTTSHFGFCGTNAIIFHHYLTPTSILLSRSFTTLRSLMSIIYRNTVLSKPGSFPSKTQGNERHRTVKIPQQKSWCNGKPQLSVKISLSIIKYRPNSAWRICNSVNLLTSIQANDI